MSAPTRVAAPLEARALVNLAGVAIPAVAALVAMPLLTSALGIERFAVLMLVWTAVSYFALLDLGIGRALSHLVSDARSREVEPRREAELLGTSLALTLAIAAVLCAVGALFVAPVAGKLSSAGGCGRGEAEAVLWLTLAMLPVASVANVLTDALQAWGRVDLLNLVRIPVAILFVLAPLAVYPHAHSFPLAVAAMLAMRLGGLLALAAMAAAARRGEPRRLRCSRAVAVELLRFGGWAAISHFLRPLLLYLDRFLIAALLPLAAVAYYATPQEALIKLVAVPATFMSVVFPAIAAARADAMAVTSLSQTWHRHVFVLIAPASLVAMLLGPELLRLWLGDAFVADGAEIVRVLALGMLANALSQVPFTVIQAVGRPDIAARLHLWELPLYALAAGLLIWWLGPIGAAIAWTGRNFVELFALLALSPAAAPASTHRTGWRVSVAALAVGAAAILIQPLPLRMGALALLLPGLAWLTLRWWRDPARFAAAA